MKIYIYGTGSGGIKFYNSLKKDKVEVLGFLDSDKTKEGNNFLNNKIFYPETIIHTNFDYIMIASEYVEIYDFLIELGFDKSKIIFDNKFREVSKYNDILNNDVQTYNNIMSQIVNMYQPEEFVITRKIAYYRDKYLDNEYFEKYDYTRYKTLQLVSNEIYDNDIKGAVAEVGVYRGEFAKIINILFKDRKLYLFDTFEGFDINEVKHDLEKSLIVDKTRERLVYHGNLFENTNVDIVMKKMTYPNNCIIKKGFFPDTAIGVEEQFSFVSIDVDLYNPIYNALEFFYPRLSTGGYIFVHDYNVRNYLGVKKAVQNFEQKFGKLRKVPISDFGGTLIITK